MDAGNQRIGTQMNVLMGVRENTFYYLLLPVNVLAPLLVFLGAENAGAMVLGLKLVVVYLQHAGYRWDLWLRRFAPARGCSTWPSVCSRCRTSITCITVLAASATPRPTTATSSTSGTCCTTPAVATAPRAGRIRPPGRRQGRILGGAVLKNLPPPVRSFTPLMASPSPWITRADVAATSRTRPNCGEMRHATPPTQHSANAAQNVERGPGGVE